MNAKTNIMFITTTNRMTLSLNTCQMIIHNRLVEQLNPVLITFNFFRKILTR